MYIGTSVYQRSDYEVTVTNPSGAVTSYDVVQNGNGYIGTRAQELAGPKPLNSAGYTPITYSASEEGIYTVNFYGNDNVSLRCSRVYNSEEWTSGSLTSTTASWDMTVVSSSGAKIDGRVFAPYIYLGASTGVLDDTMKTSVSFYALTQNGYQYKILVNQTTPQYYHIGTSNMGNMVNNHSAYTSYHLDSTGYSRFQAADFNEQSNGGVMNRLFYNKPDSNLLSYLGLPANGTPVTPTASNLSFTSTSGNSNSIYGNEGGTFKFNCSSEGEKYELTLDFGTIPGSTNKNQVILTGTTAASNSVFWNGKDGLGNKVTSSNISVDLSLHPGETHFTLEDFEFINSGIVFQRLNGNMSEAYKVYYDHSPKEVDGLANGMDKVYVYENGNFIDNIVSYSTQNGWVVDASDITIQYTTSPLSALDGIDSSSGVTKTANSWSDNKSLDFWTYDDSIAPLSINVKVVSDEKINIQINKIWDDDSDRDGMRPSTISVKLLQNETEYDTATITGSTGNTWTYTFRNLPKYNTDGELFDYSIEEVVE